MEAKQSDSDKNNANVQNKESDKKMKLIEKMKEINDLKQKKINSRSNSLKNADQIIIEEDLKYHEEKMKQLGIDKQKTIDFLKDKQNARRKSSILSDTLNAKKALIEKYKKIKEYKNKKIQQYRNHTNPSITIASEPELESTNADNKLFSENVIDMISNETPKNEALLQSNTYLDNINMNLSDDVVSLISNVSVGSPRSSKYKTSTDAKDEIERLKLLKSDMIKKKSSIFNYNPDNVDNASQFINNCTDILSDKQPDIIAQEEQPNLLESTISNLNKEEELSTQNRSENVDTKSQNDKINHTTNIKITKEDELTTTNNSANVNTTLQNGNIHQELNTTILSDPIKTVII